MQEMIIASLLAVQKVMIQDKHAFEMYGYVKKSNCGQFEFYGYVGKSNCEQFTMTDMVLLKYLQKLFL